jgi:hypothetical protein
MEWLKGIKGIVRLGRTATDGGGGAGAAVATAGTTPLAAGGSTAALQPTDRDNRAIERAFGDADLRTLWATAIQRRRDLPAQPTEVR